MVAVKNVIPLFVFSLLLQCLIAKGQRPEQHFTRYTITEGLSDNYITGITQDATGYIWLSTYSGLNRYNGSRFVKFYSNSDSLSPASDVLSGITRLDNERIAVYTSGLHIINTRTGASRNLFIPYQDKQYQYKFNMIVEARGDDKGNVYVLTRSGFYHFDKNDQLVFRFDYFSANQVQTEHFYFGVELLEPDPERFIIVATAGLYIYTRGKQEFRKLEKADCPPLYEFTQRKGFCRFFQPGPGMIVAMKLNTDSIVTVYPARNLSVVSKAPFPLSENVVHFRSKLIRGNDSIFYLTGHSSGFYRMILHQPGGSLQLLPEKFFDAYLVTGLLMDRDKQLWITTSKGLFREDELRSSLRVTPIPAALEAAFPNMRIDAVYATDKKVYAGTRAQGGLLVFDRQTLQFEKRMPFAYDKPGTTIYKIEGAGPATLLLGGGGSLFLYHETTGKQTRLNPPEWTTGHWTGDLFRDSKGFIWISAYRIYRFDPVQKQFTLIPVPPTMPVIPFAIREDNDGNMWMAGHGIVRYNTRTQQFDFSVDSFPFLKMPDKQVSAMVIDRDNTIWFGSVNNGLTGYNIDKKTFRHFTRSNGLPDDNIGSLTILGNQLWISCYSGIASMDLHTFQIKRFGKEEGFPASPVLQGSGFYYDSLHRHLYLGYQDAVARFNPHAVLLVKKQPGVFVESIRFDNKKSIFLPGNTATSSWRTTNLMFTIGSINFSDGNSQGYAYRVLKEEDSTWQQLGSQSSFSISNLSPGTHRIQVKIFSLTNRWPEQVNEITLTILPPFWQKTGFKAAFIVLLLGLLYLLINWRAGVARKKEMEKTQVEKLRTEDYKNRFELEQISNYFSSSLAGKKTVEEVLWDVAGNLIGRMNYADCMIYLWNEDKTKMVQKAAYGPKGKPEYIAEHVFDVLPGQGVVGHVMETLQPVLIRDTRKDSRYRVDEAFRLSEICVPIIHNNELLGIIDSEHHEADYFTERDIKILTTIATLIGNKIKQLQSEQHLQVKQQELTNINEQLAEAKLSALQAQMNPHFVFNALNSIKRMILENENEKASRYLSKFALMIRLTLNHSRDVFVTLQENIEYLRTYLEMEQLRFDDSFTWKITTAENIDTEEIPIPSLMIQPLVENAIWHGLLQSAGEKKLAIGFTRQEDTITCTIEDNGIGIRRSGELKEQHPSVHRSVGLENLRNRIKIMNEKYNIRCTLDITDLGTISGNGQGTRVVLRFNMVTT